MPFVLAPVDLLLADRAGRDPRAPAPRVLHRPVGQVQVERPHRGQALPVVDPRGLEPGLLPGPARGRLRRGPQPPLPALGHLDGQRQAVDARVVCLDVGPEPLPQVVGQRVHAGVVQRGLTLPQVVHQQVADRAADQPVAVDQLLGGPLPAGAQLPKRPGRLHAQDTELAQGPVEQRAAAGRVGPRPGVLGVEQLHHIPDGDVGERAALGRDDQGAAVERLVPGHVRHTLIVLTQCPKPGEPAGIPGGGEVADQGALPGGAGEQPVQRGSDEVGGDQHRQRLGQRGLPGRQTVTSLVQPSCRHLPPRHSRRVGPAAHPAVLPGQPRLISQPAERQPHAQHAGALAARVRRHERCAGQPHRRLGVGCPGGRPRHRARTRHELPRRRRCRQRRCQHAGLAFLDGDAHDVEVPNRTCRVSGR